MTSGVQCRTREYSLEVPSQVTVQDGLCVHIPCQFTYPESHNGQHAPLYGYWYAEDKPSRQPCLVATSNPGRIHEIDPRVRRRFEVSGPKLNSGDCSLTINEAEAADQTIYHFQMEKGHRRWSYSAARERLSVIVTVLKNFQTESHNSVEGCMYFIPTVEDHRKNVTCGITYGEGSNHRSVEKTVMLNIHHPPRILPFSGHIQDRRGDANPLSNQTWERTPSHSIRVHISNNELKISGLRLEDQGKHECLARNREGGIPASFYLHEHDVQNFPDVSDSQIVTWTDDSLLVRCEADANPPSNQTWVRAPSHSSRLHISNNELKISGLRLEDTGKYECQARNQEGTSRASFYLHVQGVQCKKNGYNLEVSSQVTVQVGLRVHIPCNFTYDASRDDPRAQLYGYWYMEEKRRRRPRLVATSNPDRIKEIDPRVRRRFEVSGPKLNQSDCSLTIHDAEAADQATYHFRMEKGRNKYSYSAAGEKLSVIVTEKPPDVTVSGLLRAGQEARITCIAHRRPSSDQPKITWTGIPRGESIQRVSSNRVESHVDFTPTAADHLQNVTCKATYFRVPEYMTVNRTVTLSVNYPPRKLQFSGHLTRPNGDVQDFTNFSQIVPREGDSLLVRCEADSNPESFVGWKLRFPGTHI
ncbi:PREDICTED: sialic acid-binding Ig-like lectin 12 [Gekko japonicus]|uniref:Sialic acid-binding Ig-like lectin 12 n=1 Tax=Gekko japonicus TaxID=146911 RepID=A0ABM1KW79_GEKJA|nr:PREDICTED: sialic acid-binding Ig-like lectin 12 [Gekko japonicus]